MYSGAGSNPHAMMAALRKFYEKQTLYHYYRPGFRVISVGSSLTRDLTYNMTIHSLSPILMLSDADRANILATKYIQIGDTYYCNGQCGCLTHVLDGNVICTKHTACTHTL